VSRAVMPRKAPIVGVDVPDQTRLRKSEPIRDLDEFLEFLARLEAVLGPPDRRQELTVGDHFLL
jgi:hypothetical protein